MCMDSIINYYRIIFYLSVSFFLKKLKNFKNSEKLVNFAKFSCRRLHEEYHFSITIAQAIIAFYVISNLFATTFVDPGIIKRGKTKL